MQLVSAASQQLAAAADLVIWHGCTTGMGPYLHQAVR